MWTALVGPIANLAQNWLSNRHEKLTGQACSSDESN